MGDFARRQSLPELVRSANPAAGILRATMEGREMTIKRVTFIRSIVLAAALVAVGAWSPSHPAVAAASANCIPVGGTFMTNLGAIGGTSVPSTTLGRVTGDLSGAVAATIETYSRVVATLCSRCSTIS